MLPLRLRALPESGESLPGFLVRQAERARLRSVSELAAMAGLRQPGSTVSNDDLGPLSSLTKAPIERLETMAYRVVGKGRHHFHGGVVDRDLIALSPRRACPACLADAPFHRMVWDLAPATACIQHACRLITACPSCGRLLDWHHPSIAKCPCGQPIADAPTTPVTETEVEAVTTLHRLVGNQPIPWLHPTFTECDRSDLVKITLLIGMAAIGWTGRCRVVSLVATGSDATAAVTIAGVDGLRQWPESLSEIERQGIRPPWVWSGSAPSLIHLRKVAR
ncbi:TniQ family protein [Azospirillum sp. TSH64]|uniref:TniQ family protein n=1 Tax=Azospirillum sp. TSH64 TaxID=652740 RepID=UPI000D643D4F|nr:TniQ family protein [Azospirillum sp. TSH64]